MSCTTHPFRHAHKWRYSNRQKKSQQVFKQESHGCTSQFIPFAQNLFGCCLNHCTTAFCTSFSSMNVQPLAFCNGWKTWKITWQSVRTVCRMSEHLPLHGIQLVMNTVGHIGMGTVMQHDGPFSEFTLTFVLDLSTQILKSLTVTVCADCQPYYFSNTPCIY